MKNILLIILILFGSEMKAQDSLAEFSTTNSTVKVLVGAERTDLYLKDLKGKNIALVVNPTSTVGKSHLVDFLVENGVVIKTVFAPEHGFRGTADAGERINDDIDQKTGILIKSLYGSGKKPSPEDLQNIDVVIFDIQDVGVRFYTYISTMHYVMQACAENKVAFWVFDRPNPNGFYVDGPVLDASEQSFVGMHPVPIVHGMTIGEFSQMINEEGWLGKDLRCELRVFLIKGWSHKDLYHLPIKPSPNLPNMSSIYLYPSLGLFEGTNVSAGRGTEFPFQTFGSPTIKDAEFEFVPKSVPGAKNPKYLNQKCFGKDLRDFDISSFYKSPKIQLEWVIWAYQNSSNQNDFFLKNHFYSRLAGTKDLQQQIIKGVSLEQIRESWQPKLDQFRELRKKYLLYPDFN